jgi:hypothetical protein
VKKPQARGTFFAFLMHNFQKKMGGLHQFFSGGTPPPYDFLHIYAHIKIFLTAMTVYSTILRRVSREKKVGEIW